MPGPEWTTVTHVLDAATEVARAHEDIDAEHGAIIDQAFAVPVEAPVGADPNAAEVDG